VESGRLIDLLSNPASSLGRALQPRRGHQDASAAASLWHVSYGETPVPADWLTRLAGELGTGVSLLGASIENLRGATVGHATIAVNAVEPDCIAAALSGLGLHSRLERDLPQRPLEDVA
jgi:D-methionine transport system ATP-binding protein